MKQVFALTCSLALLAASCSPRNQEKDKPSQKPVPPAVKNSSPFDGTTKALQEMRIPEIQTDQQFKGFEPEKKKQKEKPR